MAKGKGEDVLELCVQPFENEFEEEQMQVECESALEKLRNSVVDSESRKRLKKQVEEFKKYLMKKAIYMENVLFDAERNQRARKKLREITKAEAAAEEEAKKNQSERVPTSPTICDRQIPSPHRQCPSPSTYHYRGVPSPKCRLRSPINQLRRRIPTRPHRGRRGRRC